MQMFLTAHRQRQIAVEVHVEHIAVVTDVRFDIIEAYILKSKNWQVQLPGSTSMVVSRPATAARPVPDGCQTRHGLASFLRMPGV